MPVNNLVKPILSEKTMRLAQKSQFTFAVKPQTSLDAVKAALESLFKVEVVKLNRVNLPAKPRRTGQKRLKSRASRRLRVIATLKPGQTIDYWQTETKKKTKKKLNKTKGKKK